MFISGWIGRLSTQCQGNFGTHCTTAGKSRPF
jgi:hypothetical protein